MASDPLLGSIVDAVGIRFTDLAGEVLAAARHRVADSVACALGGFHTETSRTAWRIATTAPGQRGYVIGRSAPVSLESAAFCNTAMMRCQDYNDSYNQVGSGHPSDLIGTALAVAGHARVSGAHMLAAVAGAYDALCGMWDRARIGRVVWDQGTMVAPVSAALAGVLLGLPRPQVAHAVAMSAVSSISVRQTRQGQLSMWKNLATAFAAKSGTTAALLASHGATGPDQPFVGSHGVARGVFPDGLGSATRPGDRPGAVAGAAIARTNLKFYPCCYHAHTSAELAAEAAGMIDVDRIAQITVRTYEKAFNSLAADPERWRPSTAETADHSLPFVVAVALRDRRVDQSSFRPANFTDPTVLGLMDKVKVVKDDELTAAFPDLVPTRMEITHDDGRRAFTGRLDYPRGHHQRPATAQELEDKFLGCAADAYREGAPAGRLSAVYRRLMALENESDVGALLATLPPAG